MTYFKKQIEEVETDKCIRFVLEDGKLKFITNYDFTCEFSYNPEFALQMSTDLVRKTALSISENVEKDFWKEVSSLDDFIFSKTEMMSVERIYFMRVFKFKKDLLTPYCKNLLNVEISAAELNDFIWDEEFSTKYNKLKSINDAAIAEDNRQVGEEEVKIREENLSEYLCEMLEKHRD